MPPCWIFGIRSVVLALWRGFVWRLATLRPSTTTAAVASGDIRSQALPCLRDDFLKPCGLRTTRSTVPRLPASLPTSTTTVSPLRISGTLVARGWRLVGGHHSTSGASETIFM